MIYFHGNNLTSRNVMSKDTVEYKTKKHIYIPTLKFVLNWTLTPFAKNPAWFFFYQMSWLFLHNIYRPQNSEKKFTVLMKILIWYFIMLSSGCDKFIVLWQMLPYLWFAFFFALKILSFNEISFPMNCLIFC